MIILTCAVHGFSSAFNTIQLHLLIGRLIDQDTNHTVVLCVRQFLCDRPRRVGLSETLFDKLIVNTGTPQGCVLSLIFFPICTNEVAPICALLIVVKFADDLALVARLQDEDSLVEYFLQIDLLTHDLRKAF